MTTINAVGNGLTGTTGSGAFVGATSPTLVTPAIGTPTSGTLTNCTGLPVSTGISGLGTGVATALAAGVTGSGDLVLVTSPTLITPTLGAASATSINFGGGALSTYVPETSWIPVFTFATPGDLSVSYATQTGIYVQIGNIVYYTFSLVCTPTFTTSSGALHITGLPVTVNASIQCIGTVANSSGITYTGTLNTYPVNATTYLEIYLSASNVGLNVITTTNFATTVQTTIYGTGFYFV